MTEAEAIQIALRSRERFGLSDAFVTRRCERRIIELVEGQPVEDPVPPPGPVYDLVAWVVTLAHGAVEVELAIDDSRAQVVRLRRYR